MPQCFSLPNDHCSLKEGFEWEVEVAPSLVLWQRIHLPMAAFTPISTAARQGEQRRRWLPPLWLKTQVLIIAGICLLLFIVFAKWMTINSLLPLIQSPASPLHCMVLSPSLAIQYIPSARANPPVKATAIPLANATVMLPATTIATANPPANITAITNPHSLRLLNISLSSNTTTASFHPQVMPPSHLQPLHTPISCLVAQQLPLQ